MNQEPISNQALLIIGTITAVVVAIYAGNWQADLLAQTQRSVCGNGVCEQGEDIWVCATCAVNADGSPMGNCPCGMICEQDCKPLDRCSTMDCQFGCKDGKCLNDCRPIVCKDRSIHDRCAADGSTIAYFRDPCGPLCGNNKCEEGENPNNCAKDCIRVCPALACAAPPDDCEYTAPYATNGDGCVVDCGQLKCEDGGTGGCVTVDCAAPPFGCKYINQRFDGQCMVSCGDIACGNRDLCGNGTCDEGEADKFDPGGCGPGASSNCLGPPARLIPGSCPNDCEAPQHYTKPSAPRVCFYHNGVYKVGDTFKASDGCNKCYCNPDRTVSCTEMACEIEIDDDDDRGQLFRYAKWQCRDGSVQSKGGPTSCKQKSTWHSYADIDCRGTCDSGQCVQNIAFDGECGNTNPPTSTLCFGQYRPGENFPSSDGCNTCFCSDTGEAVCTLMACSGLPELPGERRECYSSQDCREGTVCSVEFGDCRSGPCGPDGDCDDVCTGFCIQKDFDAELLNSGPDYEDEVRIQSVKSRFSDVDGTTLEGQAANALANDNVIGGFPDGTFGGGKPVNRAETAKFIVKALLGEVPDRLNNGRFLDAIEGEWYVKYIITAAEYGYLNGYPDGTFGSEKTVNRAELSEMLVNAFNLPKDLPHTYTDVVAGSWYGRNAGAVQLYDLFPGGSPGKFMPGQDVTRGGVAISIYKLQENR